MISPDGSVTASMIGRLAFTSGSAMPVSCGRFPPHTKLSQSMPDGPALAVAAVPSTAASAAANKSVFMAVSSGSVIAAQRKSTLSPDGSVTTLMIGRLALTSDSAMPVSCGPFLGQSASWQPPPALAAPAAAAAAAAPAAAAARALPSNGLASAVAAAAKLSAAIVARASFCMKVSSRFGRCGSAQVDGFARRQRHGVEDRLLGFDGRQRHAGELRAVGALLCASGRGSGEGGRRHSCESELLHTNLLRLSCVRSAQNNGLARRQRHRGDDRVLGFGGRQRHAGKLRAVLGAWAVVAVRVGA